MGHEHDRGVGLPVERLEQLDDAAAGVAVEISRRLVGEEDARRVRERAGDRHALLFAAGQLHGEVVQAVAEPDAMQQLARAVGRAGLAAQLERYLHVLERGERGNQLEALKDEPDFFATELRALVLAEGRQVGVVEEHLTARRCIKTGEQAEQRRLAAARRPDDGDEGALRDAERDVAQHGQLVVAAAIFFGEVPGKEHVA